MRGKSHFLVFAAALVLVPAGFSHPAHAESKGPDPSGAADAAEIAHPIPPCDAQTAQRPPDPRCGESLDGRPPHEEDPGLLFVPRALLTLPRVASRTFFWPIVRTGQVVESYQLFYWATAILTSDDGRIGLRPELNYSSGFLPTAGARFFYHPKAAPQAALVTKVHTAASDAYLADASFSSGPPWGLGLHLSAVRRRDHLFAGIGPTTQSELQRQGRGLGRYAAAGILGEVTFTQPVNRLLAVDLVGRLERRDYSADRIRSGPSITDFYGAPPGSCPDGAACVDPALVPGFDRGLRLFEVGATLALDDRVVARDGGGWGLALETTYAEGLAGDPSRHLRLGGEAVWALGVVDRLLLFRVRGESTVVLGSHRVPFERLPSAAGRAGLRGFPEGRFRGESAVVGAAEYRWFITSSLDASLFVDLGTVAGPRFDGLTNSQLFPSVGFGFRRYPRTNIHWQAEVQDGIQVAYAKEAGFRLMLSVAAF